MCSQTARPRRCGRRATRRARVCAVNVDVNVNDVDAVSIDRSIDRSVSSFHHPSYRSLGTFRSIPAFVSIDRSIGVSRRVHHRSIDRSVTSRARVRIDASRSIDRSIGACRRSRDRSIDGDRCDGAFDRRARYRCTDRCIDRSIGVARNRKRIDRNRKRIDRNRKRIDRSIGARLKPDDVTFALDTRTHECEDVASTVGARRRTVVARERRRDVA